MASMRRSEIDNPGRRLRARRESSCASDHPAASLQRQKRYCAASAPLAPNWKTGGYVERLPKDPWGNPYQYLNPGVRGELDVFSLAADGAPGGEGNDADIGSWNL